MGSGKWTWMVLVATGGFAWACGGDDDSHGSNDSDSTSSTGGSSGTAGDGGTGGTAPNTTGSGTGGDAGSVGTTTATSSGGGGSTTTSTGDTGGTAGGAGDAGAAGMAGMAGAAGAPGALTGDDIRALCEADCAHLGGVGCPDFDADSCVESICMYFYIPGCEAEYAAFLECDTAADASDPNEYVCLDDSTPSSAYSCDPLFGAVLACTPPPP